MNHGEFGEEMIRSAELITGHVDDIAALSLRRGMSVEEYYQIADRTLTSLAGDTIVLVDLYGGTPSNVAMMLNRKYPNMHIICGFNLPTLINLILTRDSGNKTTDEIYNYVFEEALKSIIKPEIKCTDTSDNF